MDKVTARIADLLRIRHLHADQLTGSIVEHLQAGVVFNVGVNTRRIRQQFSQSFGLLSTKGTNIALDRIHEHIGHVANFLFVTLLEIFIYNADQSRRFAVWCGQCNEQRLGQIDSNLLAEWFQLLRILRPFSSMRPEAQHPRQGHVHLSLVFIITCWIVDQIA